MALLNKLFFRVTQLLYKVYCLPINFFRLQLNSVAYSSFPNIVGIVKILNRGNITIGKKINIISSLTINPVGGANITAIYCSSGASINIGNNVGISNSIIFARKFIKIEDDVMIGGNCQIYDSDFHSIDFMNRKKILDTGIIHAGVTIKRGAFIGTSSILLKGVEIGEESVVAAGSIVTKSIPSKEIWGGNPAKYIKKI